jgi:HEAT repeat protein
LVGDLKITEASLALAKWISVTTGDGTITLSRVAKLEASAPGKALAQIGDPAIPALVGVLQRGNLNERWNSVFTLNLIGSPSAKNALRDHLKRETDPTLRSFVENSMK